LHKTPTITRKKILIKATSSKQVLSFIIYLLIYFCSIGTAKINGMEFLVITPLPWGAMGPEFIVS
jgi:hypothetical protein